MAGRVFGGEAGTCRSRIRCKQSNLAYTRNSRIECSFCLQHAFRVKPEPGLDAPVAHIGLPSDGSFLLPKPDEDAPQIPHAEPQRPLYRVYNSADDIKYLPEDALNEGLSMVKTIKANIKKLELGSKLRKDVWLREIERYRSMFWNEPTY